MRRRVWSEFLPYKEASSPLTLKLLAAHDVEPIFAVHADSDLDALAETLRAARQHLVQPWIWPLLPKDHGYWACEQNSQEWGARVDDVLTFLEAAQARPAGVAVDLEPPFQAVTALTRSLPVMDLARLVCRHLDPPRFEQSVLDWQTIATALQVRGYETLGILSLIHI